MGGGASVPAKEGGWKVGDHVLVNAKNEARVRFVGTTELADGEWIGVEFTKPVGSHNGTVKGKQYFECKAGHGLMVRPNQVAPFSTEAKASNTIGNALKKHADNRREELRMYNVLDNHEEQANLERRAKLGVALLAPAKAPSSEIGDAEIDAIQIEPEYKGPHITWPLSADTMLDLIKAYKEGKVLHSKYVLQLLHKFIEANRKLPTVVKIKIAERSRLTIVGDTHGQLQDVLHIMDINGVPDDFNAYLFNGDFVDRGDKGVEICMLIMGFQLLYPGVVHINRGNHECRSQTQIQGFMMEVLDKYNPRGRVTRGAAQVDHHVSGGSNSRGNQVYEAFMQAFDSLPLASVVQGTVFVVHGGLFERRGIRLSHLEAIDRFREIPLSRTTFEDGLFQDMMWSDPQDERGVRPSSRGAGHFFGKDVTANFCRANNLHLVIRSHECVPDGFEFTHRTQLLTLFSASNYCGDTGNMGAFVVFKSADMQANIEQFMASQASSEGPSKLARTHRAVIAKLIDLICASKHDLYWYFAHLDSRHTGKVSRVEWADALKTVLKLDLPFMRLVNDLATVDSEGRINYGKFLDRYKIDLGVGADWHLKMVEKVYQKLVVACSDVTQAYKLFDVNDDGCVEYIEFVNALKKLDLGLSDAQLYDLMGYLDEDRDNHIDFSEFLARFQVVNQRIAAVPEEEKKWAREKLGLIGAVVFKKGDKARQAFKSLDAAGNGTLTLEEMATGLKKLCEGSDVKLSDEEAARLARDVDADNSGNINYTEFMDAFKVNDKKKTAGAKSTRRFEAATPAAGAGAGNGQKGLRRIPTAELRGQEWDSANMEDLLTTLYEYRVELAASFRLFDHDNSGKVSEDEFKKGLEALKLPLNRPITAYQIRELMHILDKDGDGHLDYDEFLSGFSILNTETGKRTQQNYRQRA